MTYYSHPEKELKEHLEGVKEIGMRAFHTKKNLGFSFDKEDLEKALFNTLYYHDIGKSTTYFQEYILSIAEEREYKGDQKLKTHALVSAAYASYKTFLSLEGKAKEILPVIVFSSIYKHHGNFTDLKDMVTVTDKELKLLQEQWKELKLESINETLDYQYEKVQSFLNGDLEDYLYEIPKEMEYYFLFNLFFSILTYADKNEAIFSRQLEQASLTPNLSDMIHHYKKVKFGQSTNDSPLNQVRNDIFNLCENQLKNELNKENRIFSINVPTGRGKT
jgi:CRISPR-associated endonuclease/helicase Cas3